MDISSEIFNSEVKNFTIVENRAFVITNDGLLSIINITDPTNPYRETYIDTPGIPISVAINGEFAYVADSLGGLQVYSLKELSQPERVGFIGDLGLISKIIQIGNLTYVARGELGIDIFDLANFIAPVLIGHYDAGGIIGQMDIEKIQREGGGEWDRGILVVSNRLVQIVDFTNPQQPGLLNSYDLGTTVVDKVIVRGNQMLAVHSSNRVLISRVRNDGQIEQLFSITDPRVLLDFAILEDTAFLAGGAQGLRAFNFSDPTGIRSVGIPYSNFWYFKIWIVTLSFGFLLVWLAFFAQFALPVRTFRQRQKIFDRVILYLLGGHGPAIFIENGQKVERVGESDKKGPGVAWLDTASAAVIRTATKFKEAIGPGVHFIERAEFLTEPIDLHIQNEVLGPREQEKPFEEKREDQSDETYNEIQKNRMMTSALTRDGIEVVPNITVVFRVDTKPAHEDQPGSHFGYRTGTSQEEKAAEKEDKEAIFKAIVGEGIDATVPGEMLRHRVAWNQLPGRLAVDVWREYVAKFTLDELFQQSQPVTPSLQELENIGYQEPENQNSQVNGKPQPLPKAGGTAGILREINSLLSNLADWLEGREQIQSGSANTVDAGIGKPAQKAQNNSAPENQTALQVINEMVQERLSQPLTKKYGDTGVRVPGELQRSKEFYLLQKRGLKVINVSIRNLQFSKKVEDQIVSQWTANWLNNAKAERDRIERRQKFIEISGEEEAANEYVHTLARHFVLVKPHDEREALRALLMRSRFIIARDNELQYRMSTEWQYIEDILRWLENR
jgi:hypothetical protein